jgi:hypothetical protein
MDVDTRRGAMNTLDWIVCLGSERPVANGRVECPTLSDSAQRGTMSVERCLECRHLVATPIDRMAESMCSVGDPFPHLSVLDSEW